MFKINRGPNKWPDVALYQGTRDFDNSCMRRKCQ